MIFDPHFPVPSDALHDVREELMRLSPAELLPIRLDIQATAQTVLGAQPEAAAQIAAVEAALGVAAALPIRRLSLVAHAAMAANGEHLAASGGHDLEAQAAIVVETRERLVLDVRSLVARKILDEKVLSSLRGGQAYKDRCDDILLLVSLYYGLGERLEHVTTVRREDLRAAEALVSSFSTAIGVRDQSGSGSSHADLRERAYTLMLRTYDQARKAITYVRWAEDDVDRITPSLFAGRGTRATAPAAPGRTEAATPPTTPIAPGLPGAPPFATPT